VQIRLVVTPNYLRTRKTEAIYSKSYEISALLKLTTRSG
jgi:hypothetical protein